MYDDDDATFNSTTGADDVDDDGDGNGATEGDNGDCNCSQLSRDWMGWHVIQLDAHLLGPPLWPLQDDSRKEIIEIHIDKLFLAHLEALRLQCSRGSIFGSSLRRNLLNKKTSARCAVKPSGAHLARNHGETLCRELGAHLVYSHGGRGQSH